MWAMITFSSHLDQPMERSRILQTNTLHKIASGGFLFFMGTMGATGLQFIIGIVVVRSLAPPEFGLIAIANTFASVFIILSVLGLGTGLPPLISKYKHQTSPPSADRFIGAGITLVAVSSIFFALLLYAISLPISQIFCKPGLETPLRCFALMVPPLSLMSVFTSVFRGLEHTLPKIVFQDIALNLLRVIIFSGVLIFGVGYLGIIWGYILTAWAIFIAYMIYTGKRVHLRVFFSIHKENIVQVVVTSLPLMGVVLINNLIAWAGTLSLGWLSSVGEVGMYSAPQRLAAILNVPLTALAFIYLPVATQTYGEFAEQGLHEIYTTTCKWVFVITIPMAFFFIIDAEFIVKALFGMAYQGSANVLRVLSVGYLVHLVPGPNNMTLVSIGRSGIVLMSTLLACMTALILFYFFVPRYGSLGAAGGVAVARIVSNLFASSMLFKKTGIHPFTREYGRILFVTLPVSGLIYLIVRYFPTDMLFFHCFVFILTVTMMFIAFFLIHGITKQDTAFVRGIEMRMRGNAKFSDWLDLRF